MPFNLPTGPSDGQTYSYNNITYLYNLARNEWTTVGSYVSLTGPTGPTGTTGPTGPQSTVTGPTGALPNPISGYAFQNYSLVANPLGNVSGSKSVDLSLGNYVSATATGSITWTFTNPPVSNAFGFILKLTNGGAYTQIWPGGIKWSFGSAPILTASGVDFLVFMTDDAGTTWRGAAPMIDSK